MDRRMTGNFLVLVLLILSPLPLAAQGTAQPALSLKLVPSKVINGFPSQVAITVESDTALPGASLEFQPPPGFQVHPSKLVLPSFSKKVTLMADLGATREARRSGAKLLVVTLRSAPSTGTASPLVTAASLEFEYAPEIHISLFLLLGSVGVLIGYVLRVLLEILKSVPRPSPAPEDDSADGPITKFVRSHYYLVDLSVAFGLCFLALVALTKDGRPPESGTYWYTALATGVSLGLLTNSELLTRRR